jgi:type IV secretory pathway TrbL component
MNDAWFVFWLLMAISFTGTFVVWAYDRVERWWKQ